MDIATTSQEIGRSVILKGITNEGATVIFHHILSLYVDADRFTPADSLECTVLDRIQGNQKFAQMRMSVNGVITFVGNVDVQTRTIGIKGSYTTFVCRSLGALMLDNEVKPYWYQQLTSQQLIQAHALPYGATGAKLPFFTTLPEILAKKGLSHWAFIEQFCWRAYQKRVYVDGNGVIGCDPFGTTMHRFSNTHQYAQPFTQADIIDDRYRMISKIFIKTGKENHGGDYQSTLNNIGAQRIGIVRERYYHPEAQWEDHAMLRAKAMLEDKQLDYFEIRVMIPKTLVVRVGDLAEFYDGNGFYTNLYVSQVRQSMDSHGAMTKLKLWNKRAVLNL